MSLRESPPAHYDLPLLRPANGVSLSHWLHRLRDGWQALVVAVILGLAAGYIVARHEPTAYAATGTVVATSQTGFLDLQTSDKLPAVTETLVQLARGQRVVAGIADRYRATGYGDGNGPASTKWVSSHLSIREVANLALIDVQATAPSQQAALRLSRSATDGIVATLNGLANSVDASGQASGRLDPAGALPSGVLLRSFGTPAAQGQVSPALLRNLLIGGNVGLLLGILAALGIGALVPRLRAVEDLSWMLGRPVLGVVGDRRRGVRVDDPGIAEATARLLASDTDLEGAALLVMAPGNAKKVGRLVEGLAESVAASGRSAVIVDCDLDRRTYTRMRGLAGEPGLSDVLEASGAASPPVLKIPRSGVPDLFVLAAGRTTHNPGLLLRSPRLPAVIAKLRDVYEFVFVLGPTLDHAGSTISLLRSVDSSAVAATRGTRLARLRPVEELTEPSGTSLLGSFLIQ
ncbi:MAG TPA: hypothetical protein VIJ76_08715 [Galbitalea sp.]